MSKSIDRVKAAASLAGLEIHIIRMGESTRTAIEAAEKCGCSTDQIVKSLVFAGTQSGKLMLFLLRGSRKLDLEKAAAVAGEPIKRADAGEIREITGFAIGGVAPIGHKSAIRTFADAGLLAFSNVWAAAGAHDAVFSADPEKLAMAAGAEIVEIADSG